MLHYSGDTPHCPACFEGLWFFSPSCSVRKSMLELFGVFFVVFFPPFFTSFSYLDKHQKDMLAMG